MTNHDKTTRPSRWQVVIEAVFLALTTAAPVYLILTWPQDPAWWEWAGILIYAVFIGYWVRVLSRTLARRAAPAPRPVRVRNTGHATATGPGSVANTGVMRSRYACDSCDGTGASGRDPETNGRCWDCYGTGRIGI